MGMMLTRLWRQKLEQEITTANGNGTSDGGPKFRHRLLFMNRNEEFKMGKISRRVEGVTLSALFT